MERNAGAGQPDSTEPGQGHDPTRPGTLVREERDGEVYEYYPLGEYIVSAPGVCGGRPTFKYTRIDVRHALACLAAGESPERISERFGGRVSCEALEEARRLERQSGAEMFERPHVPADQAA